MSEASQVRVEMEFADFVDTLCSLSGGRTARQAYDGQKVELFALLKRLATADLLDTADSEAAACLIHNLAGTATYSGEDELGDISAELEFSMPGMSGVDLLRTMRSEGDLCHVPAVMLTARRSDQDEAIAYGAGADDYLRKPIDLDFLIGRINALLLTPRTRQRAS